MATYVRTTWVNGSSGGTPIDAARLNNMEQGIVAADVALDARIKTVNNQTPDSNGNVTIGSAAGGNLYLLIQTAQGYCPPGTTTPVTVAEATKSYIFRGTATPPFSRTGIDTWDKIDVGVAAEWVEIFADDYIDAVGGSGTVSPNATNYGGDTTKFVQHPDGYLTGTAFQTTDIRYVMPIKTTAAAKQAIEVTAIAWTATASPSAPHAYLNITSNTMNGANVTGYHVRCSDSSGTATWTAYRYDAGVATSLGTFTEPSANVARPTSWRFESNGAGALSLLRNGSVLYTWTDPASTKLTGLFSGVGANSTTTGSGLAAVANLKIDRVKVFRQ